MNDEPAASSEETAERVTSHGFWRRRRIVLAALGVVVVVAISVAAFLVLRDRSSTNEAADNQATSQDAAYDSTEFGCEIVPDGNGLTTVLPGCTERSMLVQYCGVSSDDPVDDPWVVYQKASGYAKEYRLPDGRNAQFVKYPDSGMQLSCGDSMIYTFSPDEVSQFDEVGDEADIPDGTSAS